MLADGNLPTTGDNRRPAGGSPGVSWFEAQTTLRREGVAMTYLYGDSTPTDLKVNYIHLLRDAIDFSVEVLLAVQRVRTCEAGKRERQTAADLELERLADLERSITLVLGAQGSGNDTAASRCGATLGKALATAVAAETGTVQSAVAQDLAAVDRDIAKEREACVRALESLLLRDDLPGASRALRVWLEGGHYQARLVESALELESAVALDIPAGNLLAAPIRVERLIEVLDRAPEKRGWLGKSGPLHKLAKLYLVEVVRTDEETTLRLRGGQSLEDAGHDLVIRPVESKVTMATVGKSGDEGAIVLPSEDAEQWLAVYKQIETAVAPLAGNRKRLVVARLDGKLLAEHANPAVLVERLVGSMAPVVRDIASHSPVAGELVLKRVVGDDQREETFISKADLQRRLERLTAELRSLFAPLGLAPPAPAGKAVPPPIRSADDEEDTGVRMPTGLTPPDAHAQTAADAADPAAPDPVDDEWGEPPIAAAPPLPKAKSGSGPARKPVEPPKGKITPPTRPS
jgi:hypothetical protein